MGVQWHPRRGITPRTTARPRRRLMTYTLPDLPYDYAGLEPSYSAKVLELHHSKHHAAYVKGLNDTLDKLVAARSGSEYGNIVGLEKTLAFNLSGHVLHSLF